MSAILKWKYANKFIFFILCKAFYKDKTKRKGGKVLKRLLRLHKKEKIDLKTHSADVDDNTQVSLSLLLHFLQEVARERHARGARSIRERSRENKGWERFSPGRNWFSPFLSSSLLCHSLARSLAVAFSRVGNCKWLASMLGVVNPLSC